MSIINNVAMYKAQLPKKSLSHQTGVVNTKFTNLNPLWNMFGEIFCRQA